MHEREIWREGEREERESVCVCVGRGSCFFMRTYERSGEHVFFVVPVAKNTN